MTVIVEMATAMATAAAVANTLAAKDNNNHCHGSRSGRGGKDNASSGRLGPQRCLSLKGPTVPWKGG